MLTETPDMMATAIDELLDEPTRAATMVEQAERLVASRYCLPAVTPLVHAAVFGSPTPRRRGGTATA